MAPAVALVSLVAFIALAAAQVAQAVIFATLGPDKRLAGRSLTVTHKHEHTYGPLKFAGR